MACSADTIAAMVPCHTDMRHPSWQLSPQIRRKHKSNAASACVNCRMKHLKCDGTRPCQRCYQGGKEVRDIHMMRYLKSLNVLQDKCQNAVHKKRGRPLRPEIHSPRRSLNASVLSKMSAQMSTSELGSHARTGRDGRSSWLLQAWPRYITECSNFRFGQTQSPDATPSVGPGAAAATRQSISARGHGQVRQMFPLPILPCAPAAGQTSPPLTNCPEAYKYRVNPITIRSHTMQVCNTPLSREQLPPPSDPPDSLGGFTILQLSTTRTPALRYAPQPLIREQKRRTGITRQPDSRPSKMDIQELLG